MKERCFLCDGRVVAKVGTRGRWEYACLEHTRMIENSLLGQGETILYCNRGKPFALAVPAFSEAIAKAFHYN